MADMQAVVFQIDYKTGGALVVGSGVEARLTRGAKEIPVNDSSLRKSARA
jgi:hypothetical protein